MQMKIEHVVAGVPVVSPYYLTLCSKKVGVKIAGSEVGDNHIGQGNFLLGQIRDHVLHNTVEERGDGNRTCIKAWVVFRKPGKLRDPFIRIRHPIPNIRARVRRDLHYADTGAESAATGARGGWIIAGPIGTSARYMLRAIVSYELIPSAPPTSDGAQGIVRQIRI